MRDYLVMTEQDLVRMLDCFADKEEMTTFVGQITDLSEEFLFNTLMCKRVESDEAGLMIVMKQLCTLALFCRNHIELIHEMIRKLDGRTMNRQQLEDYKEQQRREEST